MQRAFTVSGVSNTTGRPCSIRVEAPDASEACSIAQSIGLMRAAVDRGPHNAEAVVISRNAAPAASRTPLAPM